MLDEPSNQTVTTFELLEQETLALNVESPLPGKYMRPALAWTPSPGSLLPTSHIVQDGAEQPRRVEFTTPVAALEFFWDDAQAELERLPVHYADECWAIKPQVGPQRGLVLPLHLEAPEPFTLTFEMYMPDDPFLRAFQQRYAEPGFPAEPWNWETPVVLRLNETYSLALPVKPIGKDFITYTTPMLPLSAQRAGVNDLWLGTNHTALKNLYVKSVTFNRHRAVAPDETQERRAPMSAALLRMLPSSNELFDPSSLQTHYDEAATPLGLAVRYATQQMPVVELREALESGFPIPLQIRWKEFGAGAQHVLLTGVGPVNHDNPGQTQVTIQPSWMQMSYDELLNDFPGESNRWRFGNRSGQWVSAHPLDVQPAALPASKEVKLATAPVRAKGWTKLASEWVKPRPGRVYELHCYALNVEINRLSQLYQQWTTSRLDGPNVDLERAIAAREKKLKTLSEHLLRLLGIHAAFGKSFMPQIRFAPPPPRRYHFFKESVIFKKKRLRGKQRRRKVGVRASIAMQGGEAATPSLLANFTEPAESAASSRSGMPELFYEEETIDLSVPNPKPTKHLRFVPPDDSDAEAYFSEGCWAGPEFEFALTLQELDQCTLTFELFIPDDPAVRALYRQKPRRLEDKGDWETPLTVEINSEAPVNLPINPLGRDFVKVTTSFLRRSHLQVGENEIVLSCFPQTIKNVYLRSVTLKRFSVQRQEQSQWCWAAVCASLVSLLTPDAAQQLAIVKQTFDNTRLEGQQMNRAFDIETAARRMGLEIITTSRRLGLHELREGHDMGLPIPLQMNWKSSLDERGNFVLNENHGHYIVVTGVEDEDDSKPAGQTIVTVEDPLKGELKLTYDELKTAYPGAANKHLYKFQASWSFTHGIFPQLVGAREKKRAAPPALNNWAARVKFARQWGEHHPGGQLRALQKEIAELLAWFQDHVDSRSPLDTQKPEFTDTVAKRERNLKAIQQHLLRLLSVREVLKNT